jgi:hypothetical protein
MFNPTLLTQIDALKARFDKIFADVVDEKP